MADLPGQPSAPAGPRLDELHVWITTLRSGAEGLVTADFAAGAGGWCHMPLMSAQRAVADAMRPLAEAAPAVDSGAKDPVVSVRLWTYVRTPGAGCHGDQAHHLGAGELRARIAAAVEALTAAPDPAGADPTRREVAAIRDANLRAWVILTAGRDPDSRRRPADRDS